MKINKKIFSIVIIIVAATTATICFLVFKNTETLTNVKQISLIPKIIIKEKQDIQLLFVGDLMFDRGIRYYANLNGSNDYIFEKIHSTLLQNDLVTANLEGPITDNKSISSGTVPGSTNNYYFTFDKSVANTLFNQNIKLVNLGNNHILNFDYAGLKSTEDYLKKANVSYFGAPKSNNSLIKDISGVKVAFISYDQFNLSQPEDVVSKIIELKQQADLVVVFSHWGEEYQLIQSENQTELAHKFIDAGADLIIGSHPHVIQPMEEYIGPDGQAKRIYYSLGNFIFDQYFDENVRNSLGVQVKINKTTKELEFQDINFYLQTGGQTIIKQ